MNAHLISTHGVKRPVPPVVKGQLRVYRDQLTLKVGEPPARYLGGRWRLDGEDFAILRVESRVTIHFESADERSGTYGPDCPALLVDGTVFFEGQDAPVAQLDLTAYRWVEVRTERQWDVLVLREAD